MMEIKKIFFIFNIKSVIIEKAFKIILLHVLIS